MPEYLAPGVFVEEVSFRPQSIEGVGTSTTGFVGPTRSGPVRIAEPPLLTSFADFERIYGGLDALNYTDGTAASVNYLAQAVRAYFEEGGRRLYVARAYNDEVPADETRDAPNFTGGDWTEATLTAGAWDDGIARWPDGTDSPGPAIGFRARDPGAAANVSVRVRARVGENILDTSGALPELRGVAPFDTIVAETAVSPSVMEVFWSERVFDPVQQRNIFQLRASDGTITALGDISEARVLTMTVEMDPMGRFNDELVWEGLSPDPRGTNAMTDQFAADPNRRSILLFTPLVMHTDLTDGASIAEEILGQTAMSQGGTLLDGIDGTAEDRSWQIRLAGGTDGERPTATQYQGDDGDTEGRKSGLRAFEDLEDISIVAAPGSTAGYYDGTNRVDADATTRFLIAHCEQMRYRVAVLDGPEGATIGDIRTYRATLDSTRAALYYPWVRSFDLVTETEVLLPPSGFATGIFVRNDVERGVHKAPANEVIRLAQGLELNVNTAQQEALNPEGINCLRFFEGRGFRVWGARTISSNNEWKYLNVRRYFAYAERSIELGSQFAVFEPNGQRLWANVQRAVSDFLLNEWTEGRLFGATPKEAFFVRCDRTTMTQNDIDNGRLICVIGIAPLRPAEFVIFRIGQWTAEASR
ncbi:MAG: phage tail sheath subtilisin-like domain-containing protein [Pseudomonadota bacterium]